MESAALLSPTDINTIRRYVHTKYAPLPGNRRAEIVADAIRRTLQQRLPNIPSAIKAPMIDQLITRCLVGEQRDVKPDDVLDLCAELALDLDHPREQLLEPILSWVNERSPGRWNSEQLASRLDRSTKIHKLEWIQEIPATVEKSALAKSVTGWSSSAQQGLRKLTAPMPALMLLIVVTLSAAATTWFVSKPIAEHLEMTEEPLSAVKMEVLEALPDTGMPERLKYAEIDTSSLKAYLNGRDSLLAEEPYFSAILDNAREYDIHPLLLFAITGQEQGFVPRSGKDAAIIANNPFNVGHSWKEFNTDIYHSAGIASRLLVKLANSRPEGHDAFAWFNNTYAEDPLWSDGVRKLFNKLNSLQPLTTKKAE